VLLIVTGLLHTAVGVALGWERLLAIAGDGLFGAAASDIGRQFAFWFVAMGIVIVILGHLMHHYIVKEQRPPPRFIGYYFLGMSAVGCAIEPVSGMWLFIPQALIIIFADRGG